MPLTIEVEAEETKERMGTPTTSQLCKLYRADQHEYSLRKLIESRVEYGHGFPLEAIADMYQ